MEGTTDTYTLKVVVDPTMHMGEGVSMDKMHIETQAYGDETNGAVMR
jgi:hypothetical protein